MTNRFNQSLEELLMGYAAGQLTTQESFLVASLLTVDARAREQVALYEACAGHLLEKEEGSDVCVSCLEGVFSSIDGSLSSSFSPVETGFFKDPSFQCIPSSLHCLLQDCIDMQRSVWSDFAEVSEGKMNLHFVVPCTSSCELFFMRLPPHESAPLHRHDGTEVTLVLEGSYTDALGQHQVGDVVIFNAPDLAHAPQAGDQGCFCLVLSYGSLVF